MFAPVLASLRSILRGLAHWPSSSSPSRPSGELEEIDRIIAVLNDLVKKCEGIEAVLDDAERRIHDESVRSWLNQLRDLADEVLDLCDMYEYEVVAREVESSSPEHHPSSTDIVASGIGRHEEFDGKASSPVSSYVSPLLDADFRREISEGLSRTKEKMGSMEIPRAVGVMLCTVEDLEEERAEMDASSDSPLLASFGRDLGGLTLTLRSQKEVEEIDDIARDVKDVEMTCIVEELEEGSAEKLASDDAPLLASLGRDLARLKLTARSQKEEEEMDGIARDLEDVEQTWKGIKAVLDDAEKRQIREKSVRQWLLELRELAEKIENLRDVFEYEVVAKQVEATKASSSSFYGDASTSKRRKLEEPVVEVRPSVITSLSPLLDPCFREQIARDLKRIKKTFKSMVNTKKALRLKVADGRMYSSDDNDGFVRSEPTGRLVTDPVFLGRDQQLSQLRDCLITDHGTENVEVIAVVGMGGMGKTTLAQHVCKDQEVVRSFDEEMIKWVHVSQKSDVVHLTKAVVEAFSGDYHLNELSPLQDAVTRLVKDKKVLLVADDVWSTESWESFLAPFHHAAKRGSKILVTTRLPEVTRRTKAVKVIDLSRLSDEDGWSLLKQHAFSNQSEDVSNVGELEEIGKKIAAKCGGLPLSLKLLGGLLSHKKDDEEAWKSVLESNLLALGNVLDLSEGGNADRRSWDRCI